MNSGGGLFEFHHLLINFCSVFSHSRRSLADAPPPISRRPLQPGLRDLPGGAYRRTAAGLYYK